MIFGETNNKRGLNMNILLSIKPEYAKLIYEGKKTIEYRKDFPKFVLWGSKIFLYETAPIKRVTGCVYFNELKKYFVDTSKPAPPHYLRGILARGCVSWCFLQKYGRGDIICAWDICEPTKLNFEEDGNLMYYTDNGNAPQSWQYTRADFNGSTFCYHKKINNHGSAI